MIYLVDIKDSSGFLSMSPKQRQAYKDAQKKDSSEGEVNEGLDEMQTLKKIL